MPLNMVKSREKANNCGFATFELGDRNCNQDAVRVLSRDAHVIAPVAFRPDCVPGAIEKPDGAKTSPGCSKNACAINAPVPSLCLLARAQAAPAEQCNYMCNEAGEEAEGYSSEALSSGRAHWVNYSAQI
jgi:hypothetical protein